VYSDLGQGLVWFTNTSGPAVKFDLSFVSRITFDGAGGFTRNLTISSGEASSAFPGPCAGAFSETGTYAVNNDGTGSWTGTLSLPSGCSPFGGLVGATETTNFVIGGSGAVINGTMASITASSGTVDSIVAGDTLTNQE
jgi:hypothetical protein